MTAYRQLLDRAAAAARKAARAAEVLRDEGPRALVSKLRETVSPAQKAPWWTQLPHALLREPRPVHAPPPRSALTAPLTINWVLPAFYPGAGGHMTIFRAVRELEARGHACTLFFTSVEGVLPADGAQIRALVHQHFQPVRAGCVVWRGQHLPEADVSIATHWDTAYVVDRRRRGGAGAYFVQDFEPLFYPLGTRAALAEETYGLGLFHLTAGPWLETRLTALGAAAARFDLAVDPAEYFVTEGAAAPAAGRIAVYLRPLTERRGFEIVAAALAEVALRRPEVEICVYGTAAEGLALPFPARKLGVLDSAALQALYASSTLGVSCSFTNYSLVPQEMSACGLPVVEVDTESTRAVFVDGETAVLAKPLPLALATRILETLSDAGLRARLRENGLARVRPLTWQRAGEQIERGLRLAVAHALGEAAQDGADRPGRDPARPLPREAR